MEKISKTFDSFLKTIMCSRRKKPRDFQDKIYEDEEELRQELDKLTLEELPDSDMSIKECGSECKECKSRSKLSSKYESHPSFSEMNLPKDHDKENIQQQRPTFHKQLTQNFADIEKDDNKIKRISLSQNYDFMNTFDLPKPFTEEGNRDVNFGGKCKASQKEESNVSQNEKSKVFQKEESKVSNHESRILSKSDEAPKMSNKRSSDFYTSRTRKTENRENQCKILALKQSKKRNLMHNFSLKNIKLAKEIWREYISNVINPEISFVEYIPSENSYKVKYHYLDIVKNMIDSKISKFGFSEKIIEDKMNYCVTSLSLSNFLQNNYYSEEIINALLMLYQGHAHSVGYLIFNTFAYMSIHNIIAKTYTNFETEICVNDITFLKGIVFPILITNPINEFICVIAHPNEK